MAEESTHVSRSALISSIACPRACCLLSQLSKYCFPIQHLTALHILLSLRGAAVIMRAYLGGIHFAFLQVNTLSCEQCGGADTQVSGRDYPTEEERNCRAETVEIHMCRSCGCQNRCALPQLLESITAYSAVACKIPAYFSKKANKQPLAKRSSESSYVSLHTISYLQIAFSSSNQSHRLQCLSSYNVPFVKQVSSLQ